MSGYRPPAPIKKPTPAMADRNESLLDMYHLRHSLNSIREGLRDITKGLREFEAGVTNLRVFIEKMDELEAIKYDQEHAKEMEKIANGDEGGSGRRSEGMVAGVTTSLRGGGKEAKRKGKKQVEGSQEGSKSGVGTTVTLETGGKAAAIELGGKPVCRSTSADEARNMLPPDTRR